MCLKVFKIVPMEKVRNKYFLLQVHIFKKFQIHNRRILERSILLYCINFNWLILNLLHFYYKYHILLLPVCMCSLVINAQNVCNMRTKITYNVSLYVRKIMNFYFTKIFVITICIIISIIIIINYILTYILLWYIILY